MMNTIIQNGNANASVQAGADKFVVLNVAIAAFTLVMFVAYLVVGANSVQRGFSLREAEQRMASLEERQERLGFQVLKQRSMGSLEEQINGLGYVPVEDLEYLSVGSPVAVR